MSRRLNLSARAAWVGGLLLCLLDFSRCPASEPPAVDGYFVQSWQMEDGLPANSVNDVVQDRKGYLWLATFGGLVRFDGVNFKVFTSPLITRETTRNILALAATTNSTLLMLPAIGGVVQLKDGRFSPHPIADGLAGQSLQSLYVDRSGAVWVGIAGGRARRWQGGKISDFGPSDGLSRHAAVSFASDDAGGVWLAGGNYLGRYRKGKLTPMNQGLPSAEFTIVAACRSGGIWICRDTRLLRWADGKFVTISTNLPWVAEGGVAREMFEDHNHDLWVGTGAHGLFRFADGKFIRVATSQSQITSITEDGEGDIWAGTVGGGLNRLRPKLFHLYDTRSGLPEDVCNAICTNGQGSVWLADRRSGVVGIKDGKVFVPPVPWPHNFSAYSLCVDNQGGVWVSDGRLYRFARNHPDQLQTVSNRVAGDFTRVRVLFKSRRGDIWVGADPALVGYFRRGQPEDFVRMSHFPGQHPRAIAEDATGRIWIGTEAGRLYQLAYGQFTAFGRTNGLPDSPIQSLYADAEGSLWIGTGGRGLVLWRDGKFKLISVADGLRGNTIAEMVEDNAGRLWFGSQRGISHVVKRDLLAFAAGKITRVTTVAFSENEGLDGISCLSASQPMACKTPDGRLWFATQQGVLAVDATALNSNSRPPPVFIDGVSVNDRPLKMTDPLRVPPLCHKIEFRFSVLSYAAPENVRLRYKLDGVDSDWIETAHQHPIIYPGLPPGKYRLHLKACNSDGVWSKTGATLSFTVLAAWWQSWWFQGLALFLFLGGSVLVMRQWSQRRLRMKLGRLEREQALETERTRIARDLHDDLGATVTQVGLMLEELRAGPLSPEELKEQSAAISGRVLTLARDLDAVVWSVNPGKDSLAELFVYLGQFFLEGFRRTPIRPRLEMAEEVPNVTLAPEARHHLFMVVKEALNNVIKHSQAGEVTLTLKVIGQALEIRIHDSGRGFSPDVIARSRRHGLPNMRARIEHLGGRLETSSEPGTGTTIRIWIPSWRALRAKTP